MRLFNHKTRSQHRRGILLCCVLTFTAGLCSAQLPDEQQNLADLQADCRIEGEAGGLSGTDLDQFVEECVADLLSVKFSNTEE
jgi:hypothetical protein